MAEAISVEEGVTTAIEEAVEAVEAALTTVEEGIGAIETEFDSLAALFVLRTNETTECPGMVAATLPPFIVVESTEGNETELSIT